jgi:hypothetical protein
MWPPRYGIFTETVEDSVSVLFISVESAPYHNGSPYLTLTLFYGLACWSSLRAPPSGPPVDAFHGIKINGFNSS